MTNPEHVTEIAVQWVTTLRGRGVNVFLRGNRLMMLPPNAYKELTDDELITLRHHREAIKNVVRNNPDESSAPKLLSGLTVSAPIPPAPPCPYCGRTPCIGKDHFAFSTLHAEDPEFQRPQKAAATAVMLRMIRYGTPY